MQLQTLKTYNWVCKIDKDQHFLSLSPTEVIAVDENAYELEFLSGYGNSDKFNVKIDPEAEIFQNSSNNLPIYILGKTIERGGNAFVNVLDNSAALSIRVLTCGKEVVATNGY